MGASYSENLEVPLDEEFFLYRIFFLVFGIVLMSSASVLSKSLVLYYSSAMAAGVFLVILMVLFQLGLESFLLRYVPGLLRSLLVEMGLPEDIHDPVSANFSDRFPSNCWILVGFLGCAQACAQRGWIY